MSLWKQTVSAEQLGAEIAEVITPDSLEQRKQEAAFWQSLGLDARVAVAEAQVLTVFAAFCAITIHLRDVGLSVRVQNSLITSLDKSGASVTTAGTFKEMFDKRYHAYTAASAERRSVDLRLTAIGHVFADAVGKPMQLPHVMAGAKLYSGSMLAMKELVESSTKSTRVV